MGTLSDAIHAVTTMEIIEAFNVPYQKKNDKVYILCPGHDDRHFGSCYVDKNDNGYYCYVCSEHVNKWNMVLKLNGNDRYQAAQFFFKTSGITPTQHREDDEQSQLMSNLKKLEKYIRNDRIYNDVPCEKLESSYGRNYNGDYMFSEIVEQNPLLALYRTNSSLFQTIVNRILSKEEARLQAMANTCKHQKDRKVKYADGVSYEDMANMCEVMQKEIVELKFVFNILRDEA